MNSSTSSFSGEWKVVAVMVITLVGAEFVVRTFGAARSHDVQHIEQAAQIVRNLHAEPSPRILFLGNSLTHHGVDVAAFTSRLQTTASMQASSGKVNPDDTNILDWYYLYLDRVERARLQPDVLIVGFALNQLSDARRAQPRHLAELCGHADVPAVLLGELHSTGDRFDFLLAHVSTLYARQETLKHRLLSAMIPAYAESHQLLNARARIGRPSVPESSGPAAYRRLDRWLQLLAATKTHAVFVAMPTPTPAGKHEPYELDERILQRCAEHGALFVDVRLTAGLTTEASYTDGYHLNEEGARIYSETLADSVTATFRQWFSTAQAGTAAE